MYLIVSNVGFYLGLSRAATEAKCRGLKAQTRNIVACSDLEDAKRCIAAFQINAEPVDVMINRLTLWKPIQSIVLLDVQSGESFLCSSDGNVVWKQANGEELTYKICQTGKIGDKKTANLLRKKDFLIFYNFVQKRTMKIGKNGDIWCKAERDNDWTKVEGKI